MTLDQTTNLIRAFFKEVSDEQAKIALGTLPINQEAVNLVLSATALYRVIPAIQDQLIAYIKSKTESKD